MANPQLEKGYTRIANSFLEAFASAKLSDGERAVMLIVIRLTWGWGKKSAPISKSLIAKLTGLNKRSVVRIVQKLSENELLVVTKTSYTSKIGIQKDFDRWKMTRRSPLVVKSSAGDVLAHENGGCQDTHKRKEIDIEKESARPRPWQTLLIRASAQARNGIDENKSSR